MKWRFLLIVGVATVLFLSGCTQPSTNGQGSSDTTPPSQEQPSGIAWGGEAVPQIEDCGADFECFKTAMGQCKPAKMEISLGFLGSTQYELQSNCEIKIESIAQDKVVSSETCSVEDKALKYIDSYISLNSYCSEPIQFLECTQPVSAEGFRGVGCLAVKIDKEGLDLTIAKLSEVPESTAEVINASTQIEAKAGWKIEYFVLLVGNTALKTQYFSSMDLIYIKAYSNDTEIDFKTTLAPGQENYQKIPPSESAMYYAAARLPQDRTTTEIRYYPSVLSFGVPEIVFTFP